MWLLLALTFGFFAVQYFIEHPADTWHPVPMGAAPIEAWAIALLVAGGVALGLLASLDLTWPMVIGWLAGLVAFELGLGWIRYLVETRMGRPKPIMDRKLALCGWLAAGLVLLLAVAAT